MSDISRGDISNNFFLKSRWIVAEFLLISITLVIDICRRRKVDVINIPKGEFTAAILFCLNHTFTPFHFLFFCQYCNFKAASANKLKLTPPLGVIDVQLLQDSEPIRLLETPKTLSEYKLIGHIFQLCSCSISPVPGGEVKSANRISAGWAIRHWLDWESGSFVGGNEYERSNLVSSCFRNWPIKIPTWFSAKRRALHGKETWKSSSLLRRLPIRNYRWDTQLFSFNVERLWRFCVVYSEAQWFRALDAQAFYI